VPTPPKLTFVPGEPVPASGMFALWGDTEDAAALAESLDLPAGEAGVFATVRAVEGGLEATDVPARLLPLLPVVRRLAALAWQERPGRRTPPASVQAWSVAAKLACELVAAGRIVPTARLTERHDQVVAHWRVAPGADARIDDLAGALPAAAHAVRLRSGAVLDPRDALGAFLDAVADACAREGRRPQAGRRARGGGLPAAEAWPVAWSGTDPFVAGLREPAEIVVGELDDWASPVLPADPRGERLLLRLLTPDTPDRPVDVAATTTVWALTLGLVSKQDADARPTAAEVWEGAGEAGALEERAAALVRGLAAAARLYPPLDRALDARAPVQVDLDTDEVAALLDGGVDALAAAGVVVEIPAELRHRDRVRLRARIGRATPDAPRLDGAGGLGLTGLTDLRYEVAVGDEAVTDEELAWIVSRDEPLVRWRGRWIHLDDDARAAAERAGTVTAVPLTEALAAALAGQHRVTDDDPVEAVATGDVAVLIDRLRSGYRPEDARLDGFVGELRPYQRRGVAWLQGLTDTGMGAVLADDMGLGKTVQAIALIGAREGDRPSLVVCPTSVLGNWARELERFAPDMGVLRHHGPDRPQGRSALRRHRVVVTTYAVLRQDADLLTGVDWDLVIFDEAQQIKNVHARAARVARQLPARARIAMTGTPIENRLSELWAIIDVTNPGLLGPRRAFEARFVAPIERWQDEDAVARLRRLIAPFVLRRRKGDPEVALDLPDKQELTIGCTLTAEQAALYRQAVDDALAGVSTSGSTFERRGRILALLTVLKQICDHPTLRLRDDGPLRGRSGKLARLTDLLAEVTATGERALVFTQFRKMGDLLVRHLGEALDLDELPFLHGGVPAGARDVMVDRFQQDDDAPPVLLVSLRAGGTGLNLTRATHVVHVDRWWNPAVEDQATDRAHRIGQERTVTVHTMVTLGTIEERIAGLLERKRALSDAVVGASETWITELDDDELFELVSLSRDVELADDDTDEDDEAGTGDDRDDAARRPVLRLLPGGGA
jgi:hypothetical protein